MRFSDSSQLTLTRKLSRPPHVSELHGVTCTNLRVRHTFRRLRYVAPRRRILDRRYQLSPVFQFGVWKAFVELKIFYQKIIETLLMKSDRHFIDSWDIQRGDNRIFLNVTEQCYLSAKIEWNWSLGPAKQKSGAIPISRSSRTLC